MLGKPAKVKSAAQGPQQVSGGLKHAMGGRIGQILWVVRGIQSHLICPLTSLSKCTLCIEEHLPSVPCA